MMEQHIVEEHDYEPRGRPYSMHQVQAQARKHMPEPNMRAVGFCTFERALASHDGQRTPARLVRECSTLCASFSTRPVGVC